MAAITRDKFTLISEILREQSDIYKPTIFLIIANYLLNPPGYTLFICIFSEHMRGREYVKDSEDHMHVVTILAKGFLG